MGARSRKKSAESWKQSCSRKEGRKDDSRQRSEVGGRGGRPTVGPRPDAAEPLDLFSLWTITLDHSTLSPMPTDATTTSCVHHTPPPHLLSLDPDFLFPNLPLPVFYLPLCPSLPPSLYSLVFGPKPLPRHVIGQSYWPHPPLLAVPLARTTLVMYCPTNQDCGNIVNNRIEEKKQQPRVTF